MEWITPKTDWSAVDSIDNRFDATDYNRIKNNLNYLVELAETLKFHILIEDMGEDKAYSSPGFYADEFNLFGTNLDVINKSTYDLNIGQPTTYCGNGKFIGYADLNRIESACLRIRDMLVNDIAKEWVLPITLSQNGRIGGMF